MAVSVSRKGADANRARKFALLANPSIEDLSQSRSTIPAGYRQPFRQSTLCPRDIQPDQHPADIENDGFVLFSSHP
jgi:hypothetical protein